MISKQLNITKEQIEEWQDSLSYKWTRWFQYTWIGSWWYDFKSGVPSLWKWRKIAYKDRDWDNSFIYDTIIFKLNNTANYIEKNKRSVGWWYDVKWLRICSNLFEKVKDDEYGVEYLDYKITEVEFTPSDKEGFSEMNLKTIEDNLDEYFNKYPNWERKAIQHIKDNDKRFVNDHTDRGLVALQMGHLRNDKAKELAFEIMNRNIDGWWD